jgi:iron complex transport system substrate-binding protein
MRILFAMIVLVGLVASSCGGGAAKDQPNTEKTAEAKRLVSLSGSITEVLFALDAEKELVAIDVTSTYPAEAEKLTNLGHVRGVTAESIIGTKPTHVLAFEDELNPQLKGQLEKAGIEVITFRHDYSVEGAKKTITDIAAWLGKKDEAKVLTAKIDNDLVSVKKPAKAPKVLFVYARGAGTMMVAGDNTQMATVIKLAGGQNATGGFDDFKPLTAEAVIAANPDVILMFDSGKSSLNDVGGVLAIPGVSSTTAGKNKAIIAMDGQLLSGFGPRTGQAIAQLNAELNKLKK